MKVAEVSKTKDRLTEFDSYRGMVTFFEGTWRPGH
jgi:hypothetical protein